MINENNASSTQTVTENRAVRSARKLVKDTRGAAMAEYVIMVGLVAVVAFAGYKTFGESVQGKIGIATGKINQIK